MDERDTHRTLLDYIYSIVYQTFHALPFLKDICVYHKRVLIEILRHKNSEACMCIFATNVNNENNFII